MSYETDPSIGWSPPTPPVIYQRTVRHGFGCFPVLVLMVVSFAIGCVAGIFVAPEILFHNRFLLSWKRESNWGPGRAATPTTIPAMIEPSTDAEARNIPARRQNRLLEAKKYEEFGAYTVGDFTYFVGQPNWVNKINKRDLSFSTFDEDRAFANTSYLMISVSVSFHGNVPTQIPPVCLADSNDRVYEAATIGFGAEDALSRYERVNPGETKRFTIPFAVPAQCRLRVMLSGIKDDQVVLVQPVELTNTAEEFKRK